MSSALLRQEVVGKNSINVVKGKVIGLGEMLKLFSEGGQVCSERPQEFFQPGKIH